MESDGTAFHHSGRTLDKMKENGKKLALTTTDYSLDQSWTVILALMDQITDKWTVSSAELIHELLDNEKEVGISEKLGISQPAVNQRKRYAGWDAIKAMLAHYEQQIGEKYG